MGEIVRELELEFDFRSAIKVEKFDNQDEHGMSRCMKAVDFLVEWDDSFWFIEVKDPGCSTATSERQQKFMKKVREGSLFTSILGPKLKDSFLYLHLDNSLPNKPMKYFVLLAIDSFTPENLLGPLSDSLKRSSCLREPHETPWNNSYIDAAMVFTEKTWNENLSQCPVKRVV